MSPGLKCSYCSKESCIRKGIRGLVQKLFCKECRRWQQNSYCNHRYCERFEKEVQLLHNEGMSVSSTGRYLHISKSSVQMLMERRAAKLSFKIPGEMNQDYQIDELQTFIRRNTEADRYYVISIMNKTTGKIIESVAGKRRKSVIIPLIKRLLLLSPKSIYTDGWNGYKSLIPKELHKCFVYSINRLERFHYTLRQRIKRLSRKSMSFSKSERMLDVSVKLFCCN